MEVIEYRGGNAEIAFKQNGERIKSFVAPAAEFLRILSLYLEPASFSETLAAAVAQKASEPTLRVIDTKEDYLGHYQRLAKEFHTRPRVLVETADGFSLGQLQILDLRQDSGYGAGVMLDKTSDGESFKFFYQRAENVRLLSEFRDQLMQLVRGAVWDGNLISKSQHTTLTKLGLAMKAEGGWNIITPEGIWEAIKAGWLQA